MALTSEIAKRFFEHDDANCHACINPIKDIKCDSTTPIRANQELIEWAEWVQECIAVSNHNKHIINCFNLLNNK